MTSRDVTLDEAVRKYGEYFHDFSRNDTKLAIGYLRSHGLTGELGKAVADKYQLGIVNPARKVDEKFEGYLAIPYLTRTGVRMVKYRCVQDHGSGPGENCKSVPGHAKVGQPYGQMPRVFNPEAFFAATNTIGIAEGEIDAIVATEMLRVPTVAIPGVDHWKANRKIWRRLFEDYEKVIIFADNDKPNAQFPENGGPGVALGKWIRDDLPGDQGLLVRCDPGEDVSSMVAAGKARILRERAGFGSEAAVG